jgi:hypothetical protein
MMKYNGHRSWAAWSVALWIGNDEGLYRLAIDSLNHQPTIDKAARSMLELLPTHTPDGAKYTLTSVREALAGLRS